MISHRSSNKLNKKKGTGYTLFTALTKGFPVAFILAILELAAFAIIPAVNLSNMKENLTDTSAKLSDTVKYVAFVGSENLTALFVLIVIAVLSILMSVFLLRFMADKKTVNVYYSLGIKRRSLFLANYFAGALLLTAVPIIAVIAGYTVNLMYVGLSWQLSVVYLHYFFGIWIFSLLMYSVSAAVFSSVGTVSEGIFYSAGIVALPSVVLVALQNLLGTFVSSVTYNVYITSFSTNEDNYYSSIAQGLLAKYASINPILFFMKDLAKYSTATINKGSVVMGNEEAFVFPNIALALPWLLVVVAAAVLGCFFFMKRNAENCGFLNTNKVLSNTVLFEFLFLCFSLPLSQARYYSLVEVIGLGVLIAVIFYIVFEIFLKRSAKRIIKSLYKLPAHAVVIAIIVGIFSTGLFGYNTYVPSADKIQSVAVAIPATTDVLKSSSYGIMNSYSMLNLFSVGWQSDHFYELPVMTDTEDINKVLGIHETVANENADAKNSVGVMTFRYTLKNGKEVTRKLYIKNDETERKVYSLVNTKACRESVIKLLTDDYSSLITDKNLFVTYSDTFYAPFVYSMTNVSVTPLSMQEQYKLKLTESEFTELKKAVAKDFETITDSDIYGENGKQLAVLSFCTGKDSYELCSDFETVTGDDVISDPEQSTETAEIDNTDDTDIIEEPDWEETQETEPENEKYEYSETAKSCLFANSGVGYDVVITDKMTNTVAYLTKLGVADSLNSKLAVKQISFVKIDYTNTDFTSLGSSGLLTREMLAQTSENAYFDSDGNDMADVIKRITENITSDKAKIDEISGKVRLHSYLKDGDYVCLMAYENGNYTAYALTAEDAPSWVTGYSYSVKVMVG